MTTADIGLIYNSLAMEANRMKALQHTERVYKAPRKQPLSAY